MAYNSLHYLLFFPIIIFIYFLIPDRKRWILLLLASYYFYMCWKLEYVLLIIASTLIDYYAGIQMGKTDVKSERKKYLIISLLVNLGLLFSFKYFNFVNESIRAIFGYYNIFYNVPAFNVLLPVGISFYTFQTLSYTIDVYRGDKDAEKHLGIFALYVSFFPQLVAGPIERSTRLLPQFFEKHDFNYENITSGLKQMLWGFFKKIVIADRLSIYVSAVYNNQEQHNGISLLLATFFFTVQVYCDFSAYSDIGIGSARVMGYDLMTNFKRPFFADSIQNLWQRWHISLTTWFKDYIYIPMGGNKVPKWRWYFNIFSVFLISGLWHGAAWTFVVFGALHGIYLVIPLMLKTILNKIPNLPIIRNIPKIYNGFKILLTFALFSFAMIFFRSLSFSDSLEILVKFGKLKGELFIGNVGSLVYSLLAILFLFIVELEQEYSIVNFSFFKNNNYFVRLFSYVVLVLTILMFGVFDNGQFIYFQF